MNSKYKITKFIKGKLENTEDLISIEEPLEISLKFKDKEKYKIKAQLILPQSVKNICHKFINFRTRLQNRCTKNT